MELQTERLKFREILSSDLNNIHDLHSLPETDQYNTLGIPVSIEETQTLLDEWLSKQNEFPCKQYVFCIEKNRTDFIGLVGIKMGKPGYSSAEIWYKIHSKHWNQGYATEAITKILSFGFTELKLHRIEAGCATGNSASIKVLEKTGFTREGLCRKILPIRGEWVDNYRYSILEEDYHIE